ncbi:MAG: M48 family metallopeptidase [Desulfobulbaceae bacterium]|nr:M48 family metallopeptidase [Desulfobulbaceae bacterium]
MRQNFFIIITALLLCLGGCENTDVWLATEAGIEAVTAFTLSDEAVQELAKSSAAYIDQEHTVASPDNEYAQRLERLVGGHQTEDGIMFNYKVYLDDTVNAFAMADGTIRIYSGLMNMLDDGGLRFVIGHEMGHVIKEHIRQKMQLAYAASAIRKGIASQNSTLGDLARSQLGGFAELLLGSQFSQLEEKIADDYGLNFLKKKEYNPKDAVSALRKLATLGANHSFLSSHPDPDKRADRLELQIQGKALPIEKTSKNIIEKILTSLHQWFVWLSEYLQTLFSRMTQ